MLLAFRGGIMNRKEALDYIHSIPRAKERTGLERMACLMEKLGNPEKVLRLIHVAGTNGKGSTARMISKILTESGYRTGLFTSPFIEVFEERIQIDEEMISEEDLVRCLQPVREKVPEVMAEGHFHPTEFEVVTALMLLYFRDKGIDYGVIEVGLGGQNDATNIISPILSVITSISYDHMNFLGDTLEEIALAKAGIIKAAPVVSASQEPEVRRVLEKKAEEKGTEITFIDRDDVTYRGMQGSRQVLDFRMEETVVEAELNLLGIYQRYNALLAVTAVHALRRLGIPIPGKAIFDALMKVTWPGRMEVMSEEPLVILDGAHNIDGIRKIRDSMDVFFRDRKRIVILGILKDKEVEAMAEAISQGARHVICVTPWSDRAGLAKDLYEVVRNYTEASYCDTYEDAVEAALARCQENDLILVCGSLYMVGDFRRLLKHGLHKSERKDPE
jgi:dihydrofolate synthase/folylpolyglutamate synthase